jgi:ABC-type sugar transport system ATPase subunit
MLDARGLRYVRDGQTILSGVGVTVDPGESLAVTGPSGSGKSSLLAVIAGLVRPAAGEVYLDGAPLTGFAGPATGVALVLQGYGLVSLLTAAENIEVALRAAGRPRAAAPGPPGPPWPTWAWRRTRTSWSRSCPAASSSGSPWPARWPSSPSC